MLTGIDVSHHNGAIDWTRVAVSFAYIKATEGANYTDPRYYANVAGAKDAGVPFGLYHFFKPNGNAVAQAAHFLSQAGDLTGQLLPMLDIEERGTMSWEQLAASALAWLRHVRSQTGVAPGVYLNGEYAKHIGNALRAEAPVLWFAAPAATEPAAKAFPPWPAWTIWQSSFKGTVAGVPSHGATDIDYVRDHDALTALMVGGKPLKIIDHATGDVLAEATLVPGGWHEEQGKVYVRGYRPR